MNSLSWLIYLADMSGNVDWLFSVLVVISVICAIILGVVLVVGGAEFDGKEWRAWRRCAFWAALTFVSSTILGSIVPSKETVYAIAASEMGERAINTQTGGKAFQALNAWLDRQIKPAPAPEKDEAE